MKNLKPTHYNGTSGSEEVYESSLESIESSNNLALKPLSGLQYPQHNKGGMNKVSSADSLLTMIRNIAANKLSASTPSSPQLSENGDALSSGYPTPLSTPDTPNGSFLSLQANRTGSKEKSKQGSQIHVSVLNPLSPKKSQDSCEDLEGKQQSSIEQPTITLEVPTFNYGKCLSPIKELPTPLPTPCPSPLPTPLFSRHDKAASMEEFSEITDSSLSFGSSVSRSSSLRKLTNKAKSIPQLQNDNNKQKSRSISNESNSYDSGEGTFDHQEHDICDATSDYSEISIPIPSFRSSSASSMDGSVSKSPLGKISPDVPIIMTSFYDSSENLCKPIHVPTKSDKQNRRAKKLVKQSNIPPNITIPQVSISFEDDDKSQEKSPLSSNSSANGSPVISPSGKMKKKPPPLIITDSNFFHFNETSREINSAPAQESSSFIKEDNSRRKSSSLESESLFLTKTFQKEKNIESPRHTKFENETEIKKSDKLLSDVITTQKDRSSFLGGKKAVVKQAKMEEPDSPVFLGSKEKEVAFQKLRSPSIEKQKTMPSMDEFHHFHKEIKCDKSITVMQANIEPEIFVGQKEMDKNFIFPCKSLHMEMNEASWSNVRLGSPPLKKENHYNMKAQLSQETSTLKKNFHTFEQPQSLDCDHMAPLIRITPMSDQESDSDSIILRGKNYINPAMDYLSPLTLQVPGSPQHIPVSTCSSESNLSSSGYSSMASPGASRRGSFNRLCISESEDTNTPTQSKNFFGTPHTLGFVKRPSPLIKSPSCDSESSDQNQNQVSPIRIARLGTRFDKRCLFTRYRTDSETTDDQNTSDSVTINTNSKDKDPASVAEKNNASKSFENFHKSFSNPLSLTLPEIVIEHCSNITEQDSTESNKSSLHNSIDEPQETLLQSPSGSSSRSESPTMSDKSVALSALHTMQCLLPNTDSEGLFDSQSSDIQQSLLSKKSPKKKEKRIYKKKISRSNSPTSKSDQGSDYCPSPASPSKSQGKKRQLRSQNKVEFRTSSSTESLASMR